MLNLLKTLKSLKFTIVLVLCLTAVFLLAQVVPQKDLLGGKIYAQWKQNRPVLVAALESIKLTDIYKSPVTLFLWALFFLNLVFIMADRIPLIWKECFRFRVPGTADAVRNSRNIATIGNADMDVVKAGLIRQGYIVSAGSNAFHAVRNRFSPLATVLFHLSFFLLLIGGVTTFYTQFRGEVDLGMGEKFVGQFNWVKKPVIGDIPWTSFSVEDVKPVYYKKTVPLDLQVVVQTKYGKKNIGINNPYTEGPLSFVIKNIDIAPLFLLKDLSGKEIDGAHIKMKGLGGKDDGFRMQGYEFRAVFFTDYSSGGQNEEHETAQLPQVLKQTPEAPEQGKEIIDPAMKIDVLKNGALFASGIIRPGEYIQFDGIQLVFEDYSYWVKFYVVKEHGLWVVYAGFVLMLAALVMRFLFFRRDIRGIISDEGVLIGGKGEFFPALFEDEFRRITEGMNT